MNETETVAQLKELGFAHGGGVLVWWFRKQPASRISHQERLLAARPVEDELLGEAEPGFSEVKVCGFFKGFLLFLPRGFHGFSRAFYGAVMSVFLLQWLHFLKCQVFIPIDVN